MTSTATKAIFPAPESPSIINMDIYFYFKWLSQGHVEITQYFAENKILLKYTSRHGQLHYSEVKIVWCHGHAFRKIKIAEMMENI